MLVTPLVLGIVFPLVVAVLESVSMLVAAALFPPLVCGVIPFALLVAEELPTAPSVAAM